MKIKNYLDKILIAIVIIIIIIIGVVNRKSEDNIDNEEILKKSLDVVETNTEKFKEDKKIEKNIIYVHVTGCVAKQGVYQLKAESRVKDLIDKAGGFCKDVDIESINLSQKLKDEMKIHVYKIGEIEKSSSKNQNTSSNKQNSNTSKININSATKEELMTLPGVGSSRAGEIIKYRDENKFQTIEDIKNISGIGEKSFEKIKEKITVD
ncbi:helix-hairpin-helix domain-containing protein [Helcococcus bovis]|uniref:helix-hairpin-helix domain-containing protein n=1 Tax=Helcococcus bovis TaxID=3153252 RepID=UPI0038B6ECF5